MTQDARGAVEAAARISYGRLLAYLSVRSRDLSASEDALSEAFAAALRVWPVAGVPDRPEAWLLTTARRVLSHGERHHRIRQGAAPMIELAYEEAHARAAPDFPDERLKLLFVCAHPDIEPAARTPLMLQTVLGLDAGRIAGAFLTSPAAMGQRLVRAKARIRDKGLIFEVLGPEAMADRLADVLSAIYAAYGTGWDAIAGAEDGVRGLAEEGVFLARLTAALLPNEPEANGLFALILYCEARRPARRDSNGAFIPLGRQNPKLWVRDLIIEAEGLLTRASRSGVFGRFQTEAAIQSVHVQRGVTGVTLTAALIQLYDLLASRHPGLGALVSRAAVYADGGKPASGLTFLDDLPPERVATYQPYWVARAHVLRLLGLAVDAKAALDIAIGLTEDPALQAFLAKGQGKTD
ncbi:MAG: DUF6596 domain-containing protein [Alphaproteobacteria bacterium]|nr:DUF6596 domain-containing protein [Alphaproteobacteria bacterium]